MSIKSGPKPVLLNRIVSLLRDNQGLTCPEICSRLGVERSLMSGLLTRLAKRGELKRELVDNPDGRGSLRIYKYYTLGVLKNT